MPIRARCPSCSAALAPAAVWCSLCHTDLRPVPAEPSPQRGRRHRVAGEDLPQTQSAQAEPVLTQLTQTQSTQTQLTQPQPVVSPSTGELSVDAAAAAEQLLAQLKATSGAAVPSVDRVPGGKWGVLVGGMAAVTLLLVATSALVGAVFLR